jgi:hypothetical protein
MTKYQQLLREREIQKIGGVKNQVTFASARGAIIKAEEDYVNSAETAAETNQRRLQITKLRFRRGDYLNKHN